MKNKTPESQSVTRVRVSASELAQMGVCERLMVFEQRHGKRATREQRQAMQRGVRAHQQFYRERHFKMASAGPALSVALRMICRSVLHAIRWLIVRWTRSGRRRNDT